MSVTTGIVYKDENGTETELEFGAKAEHVVESADRKFVTAAEKTSIGEIPELKKSVSDGKSKIAAAITGKGVETAATDPFDTMAANIGRIEAGGIRSEDVTATRADVLKGKKTITADSGDEVAEGTLELTGTAIANSVVKGQTFYTTDPKNKQTGTAEDRRVLDPTLGGLNEDYPSLPVWIGENPGYNTPLVSKEQLFTVRPPYGLWSGGYVGVKLAALRSAIGLVAEKILAGHTIAGASGTATNDATAAAADIISGKTAYVKGKKVTGSKATMGGQTITPSKSKQTISCNGKAMTGNIVVNAIPSNFVDTSVNQDLFRNGSYGAIAVGAKQMYENKYPPVGSNDYPVYYTGVSNGKMTITVHNNRNGTGNPYLGGEYCEFIPIMFKKKINLTNYKTLIMRVSSDSISYFRWTPKLMLFTSSPVGQTDTNKNVNAGLLNQKNGNPDMSKNYSTQGWKKPSRGVDYVDCGSGQGYTPLLAWDISKCNGWFYILIDSAFAYGYNYHKVNVGSKMYIELLTLRTQAMPAEGSMEVNF